MQRVIHQYKNASPIFMILESLYSKLSDTEGLFTDKLWINKSFDYLCTILAENLYSFNPPPMTAPDFPRIENVANRDNEVTVCLSGGKDSAAVAWFYKQQGYTVHLYHATGVNKAYGDEKNAAEKIAEYLGCDLFVERISLAGHQPFIEHPLKNYVIANAAIHYCLANNYTPRIAFGNFNQSRLADNPFEVCAGDCVELWDAYEEIVKPVLPEFELLLPLKSNWDTFTMLSEDWELFKLAVSCMSPYRFRAHWKHRTEEKFNVRIFENRCGCCWKCAMEELWLMDYNKMDYNEAFYRHCIGILLQTIFKESDEKVSIEDAWNHYMFYPIENSHAKDYITGYKILYRKVAACEIVEE